MFATGISSRIVTASLDRLLENLSTCFKRIFDDVYTKKILFLLGSHLIDCSVVQWVMTHLLQSLLESIKKTSHVKCTEDINFAFSNTLILFWSLLLLSGVRPNWDRAGCLTCVNWIHYLYFQVVYFYLTDISISTWINFQFGFKSEKLVPLRRLRSCLRSFMVSEDNNFVSGIQFCVWQPIFYQKIFHAETINSSGKLAEIKKINNK